MCIVREDGQAAAEYALILTLIVAVLISAYASFGGMTVRLFDQVVSQL